jgi:arginase
MSAPVIPPANAPSNPTRIVLLPQPPVSSLSPIPGADRPGGTSYSPAARRSFGGESEVLAVDVSVLGVPFNGIGTPPEAENPAQAVRDAGLVARLATRGHHVTDLGDLPIPAFSGRRDPATGVLNQAAWRQVTEHLAVTLRDRLDSSHPIILLGGDCAIMTGVAAAVQLGDRPLGILYVDGHADCRMPADSPSGEPADLVLTALTGRIRGLFGDLVREPLVRDGDLLAFGFREADRIAESGIATFDRARIRRMGTASAVQEALGKLADRTGPVWVHFDVDVLDPSVMPTVIFPERDGLSAGEVKHLLGAAFRTLPVVGMSIACYHPRLDPDGVSARLIVDLISAALARETV